MNKISRLIFIALGITILPSDGDQSEEFFVMPTRREHLVMEPAQLSSMDSLRIIIAGHVESKTERVAQPYPHYALGIVTRGSGDFCSPKSGQKLYFDRPFFFNFSPNDPVNYGPLRGRFWDERYIALSGFRIQEWLRFGWWPEEAGAFLLGERIEVIELHQQLLSLLDRPSRSHVDQAKLLVERIVFLLHEQRRCEGRRRQEGPGMERLLALWREHPRSAVDFPGLSRELGMSYSLFRKRFREETGLSPYQALLNVRIDHACKLLVQTRMQVKQIAYESGFDYVESFNRAFKKVKGVSPLAYREGILHGGKR